jgi:hypothetical protein
VIEEAPELAKNRHERWWRNTQFWAAFSTESWVTLTPERLEQLGNRIGELVQKYVEI